LRSQLLWSLHPPSCAGVCPSRTPLVTHRRTLRCCRALFCRARPCRRTQCRCWRRRWPAQICHRLVASLEGLVGPGTGKARHQAHRGGVRPSAIVAVRGIVARPPRPTHSSSRWRRCQRRLGVVAVVALASSPASLWRHRSCRRGAGVVTLVASAMSHCCADVVAVIALTSSPLLRQRYRWPILVYFLFFVLRSYSRTHHQILL
jgi:hypothetical protein